MGIVIPFEPGARRKASPSGRRAGAPAPAHEQAVLAAVQAGADRRGVLEAATGLLQRCSSRYGFAVMRPGLPADPEALAGALVTLSRCLASLDREIASRLPAGPFGVYFGQSELAWLDDGYGGTLALAVPTDIAAEDLTQFLRLHLGGQRRA